MKIIEVVAATGSADTIRKIASNEKLPEPRFGMVDEDGRQTMRIIVSDHQVQSILDKLQTLLGAQLQTTVCVIDAETVLTVTEEGQFKTISKRSKKNALKSGKRGKSSSVSRETLYADVSSGVYPDFDYFTLVVLSTIVATIGLIENNVAVIIGAMVIAPLLGPNLALTLGVTLGDPKLVRRAAVTLGWGMLVVLIMSISTGFFLRPESYSFELLSRTHVGPAAIALALASGAAGALSLTAGVSSVLVGVMVAVALLPPAATLGLMLGQSLIGASAEAAITEQASWKLALGAGLLLMINIVCVNLAALVVFFAKGITPRTHADKKYARQAARNYLIGWGVFLALLSMVIYFIF